MVTSHSIKIEQNKDIQIKRLQAQRRLYDEVRKNKTWRINITFMATVLLGLFAHFSPDYPIIGALIAFVSIVAEELYQIFRERKLQQHAAHIQELFDTEVLKMDWPRYKLTQKPSAEDVYSWAMKYDHEAYKDAPLENWYEGTFTGMPLSYARLICQKSNLTYDVNLRKAYQRKIMGTAIGLVAVTAVLTYMLPPRALSWMTAYAITIFPLVVVAAKEWLVNHVSINSIKEMKARMDSGWQQFLENSTSEAELEKAARSWQDDLLRHRETSPLIPANIFKKLRHIEEDVMYQHADALVNEAQHALDKRAGQ